MHVHKFMQISSVHEQNSRVRFSHSSSYWNNSMHSSIYICITILIFNGNLIDAVSKKLNYTSLIIDVHKYYGTSSVFFVFSSKGSHIHDYSMVHRLCREFSRKDVLTLTIQFENLYNRTSFYRGYIVRPLIVVIIQSVQDTTDFYENTTVMNKSYPIWLVIFVDKSNDDDLCDYCNNPPKNILGLRFDTEMLVMCCYNGVLTEWWSLNGNRTEMSVFANWTENAELKTSQKRALYARRHKVNGTGLRIGLVEMSTVIYGENSANPENSKFDGFFGKVLNELKRAMNFTISSVIRSKAYGSRSSRSNEWSGMVGQLAREEADIGVSDLAMTNARLGVISYTLPLLVTRSVLYIEELSGPKLQWYSYFEAFAFKIWMTILIILMTTPILLTVIKIRNNTIPLPYLLSENYLHVWGIFCQQGLSEFPNEAPLRIAYFSIFLSALVVSAAYSASLISFLTVYHPRLPFSTMEGFVNDGSYNLIVFRDSAEFDLFTSSKDGLLQKMKALMKPWKELPETFAEGFEQVCSEKVAFYASEFAKSTVLQHIPCKILTIECGLPETLAMAVPADSQWIGVLNYHIQRFRDNGVMMRLRERYFMRKNPPDYTIVYEVTLWGVTPILSVFAAGTIIAFVILFSEKACYFIINCIQRWSKWLKTRGQKKYKYQFRKKLRKIVRKP